MLILEKHVLRTIQTAEKKNIYIYHNLFSSSFLCQSEDKFVELKML